MLRKRCAELASLQLFELDNLWEIKSRRSNPARASAYAPTPSTCLNLAQIAMRDSVYA